MPEIRVDELATIDEYEVSRSQCRSQAIGLRRRRRMQVGDRVSLVFENRETVLFEIHEAMRAEGITDRDTLQAECDVYSSILPSRTELSATLQIATSGNGAGRGELEALAGLVNHVALVIGGDEVMARGEPGEPGEPTAPVTHVRFVLSERQRELFSDLESPVVVRITHSNYQGETRMMEETRRLTAKDLE